LSRSAQNERNRKALVSAALSNPLEFFTVEETGIILGDFTPALMTAIIKAGAPIVNRKMNPHHVAKWLEVHARDVGKVRPD